MAIRSARGRARRSRRTKKVGPSFKDVSAKYKGKPEAESALVAKLSGGKEHPAVKASGEDLKGLVKWVLSQ